MINATSNLENFNILYALGDWNETESGFISNSINLKQSWFNPDNSDSITLNSKTQGTWLQFKKGEDKKWKECNSTERNFYVTIVRTQIPQVPTELAEARMLQVEKPVQIIFGVYQGTKAAYFMKAAWTMLVAVSIIAFAF